MVVSGSEGASTGLYSRDDRIRRPTGTNPHGNWHWPWEVFHGNWTGSKLSGGEFVPNKLAPLYRDIPAVDTLDLASKYHDLQLATARGVRERTLADAKFVTVTTLLGMRGNIKAALAANLVPFREVSNYFL